MGNAIKLASLSEYSESVSIYQRNDADMSDRMNYMYTPFMLFWLATVITCKQYVGEPIQCWTPQHFTKHHDAYTNDVCWTRNTYYLPFNESIPTSQTGDDDKHMIVYYQWVPIILLVQAFLFCLPRIFWTTFADHSGVEVGSFVESGQLLASTQMESNIREAILKQMTLQIDRYLWPSLKLTTTEFGVNKERNPRSPATLSIKHLLSRTCFRMCGYRYANYLILVYLFTKGFNIANVIGQLLALNAFLGSAFSSYGIDVLRAIAQGEDWTASKRFPRVTMCDLNVRRLGNLHRYTVQCVLPVNLFNEKIFLFLWFWLVLVAIASCVSTLAWVLRAATQSERHRYIRRYLIIGGKIKTNNQDNIKSFSFIEDYLRQDGAFLLRLLSATTNGLTSMDMTCALWDHYFNKLSALKQPERGTIINNGSRRLPGVDDDIDNRLPEYHSLELADEDVNSNKKRRK